MAVQTLENNRVRMTVSVDAQSFEESLQQAYLKNKSRFNVPGFRKGKAPRKVVETYYGAGVFYQDALDLAFPKAYQAAVEENGIEPVDRPELDIENMDENGVTLEVTVTVKPPVTLGETSGLEVTVKKEEVTPEKVEERLTQMRERAARYIAVEGRAAAEGDQIVFDYAGSIDGVPFEGGTAQNQVLELGSGRFIPGFEPQLVGMMPGDEKDITVTFPEDYQAEELKGKAAVFACKLHEIKQKQLPELDDEFAKDASEFETLEELRADILEKMVRQAKERFENDQTNALVGAIVEKAAVEIPDCMVESQMDSMIQQMQYRMAYQGLRFEDYLKYTGSTLETLREQSRGEAYNRVKTQLVLEQLQKEKEITFTQEALDKEIARAAEQSGKSVEEFEKGLTAAQREYLQQDATIELTLEYLREHNTTRIEA